ncbi:MAG: sigma-70 family RNA polymerase sigma factor [Verrucomicrobia bacterium]|nr:sigma-70 family RNA polymerase sigma factor [Verrucomicrobiota bacterium]
MKNLPSDKWKDWIVENQDKWLLYARQQSRSEADAQDLLQESVLAIWQQSTAKAEPHLPHAGAVFTAIRFRAINWARASDRRERRNEEYSYLVWNNQSGANTYGEDEQRMLLEALRALPEAQAETVTLKIWGGLTFQEIADICQCSINTITARYRQALLKLQRELKGTFSK